LSLMLSFKPVRLPYMTASTFATDFFSERIIIFHGSHAYQLSKFHFIISLFALPLYYST
jgi:hypothetical protein